MNWYKYWHSFYSYESSQHSRQVSVMNHVLTSKNTRLASHDKESSDSVMILSRSAMGGLLLVQVIFFLTVYKKQYLTFYLIYGFCC